MVVSGVTFEARGYGCSKNEQQSQRQISYACPQRHSYWLISVGAFLVTAWNNLIMFATIHGF